MTQIHAQLKYRTNIQHNIKLLEMNRNKINQKDILNIRKIKFRELKETHW